MLIKPLSIVFTLSLFAPIALAATQAKTYPVKGFSEFVVGGNANVEITQDGSEYLRIEADEEVMQRVKVDQTGKRVSVWVKGDKGFFNWFGHGSGNVRVVLRVNHLEYLEMSGAAHVKIGNLQEDKLDVSSSGAAEADFAVLNVEKFKMDLSGAAKASINSINSQTQNFELSGAANVDIKGNSNTQSLWAGVSGASELRAKNLTARQAKVHASGASHIELTVTDELDAQASGASKVNYFGNPKAKENSSGASHINARK